MNKLFSKKALFLLPLFIAFCMLGLLSSCEKGSDSEEGDFATEVSEGGKLQEVISKALEKRVSPDKRLKAFWYFTDKDDASSNEYRLTVLDTEQKKVLVSRELTLPSGVRSELNNKAVDLVKVSNTYVFFKEYQSKNKFKLFALHANKADLTELSCATGEVKGIAGEKLLCSDGSQQALPAEDLRATEAADEQIVQAENLIVSLAPFETAQGHTTYGQRALFVVEKQAEKGSLVEEVFTKRFSGKCTDCKQINQDKWQEAFRIQQVVADAVLLKQFLIEVDDNGHIIESEPLESYIAIKPSKKKMIHLDCKENENQLAKVDKITNDHFTCKYWEEGGETLATRKEWKLSF